MRNWSMASPSCLAEQLASLPLIHNPLPRQIPPHRLDPPHIQPPRPDNRPSRRVELIVRPIREHEEHLRPRLPLSLLHHDMLDCLANYVRNRCLERHIASLAVEVLDTSC